MPEMPVLKSVRQIDLFVDLIKSVQIPITIPVRKKEDLAFMVKNGVQAVGTGKDVQDLRVAAYEIMDRWLKGPSAIGLAIADTVFICSKGDILTIGGPRRLDLGV